MVKALVDIIKKDKIDSNKYRNIKKKEKIKQLKSWFSQKVEISSSLNLKNCLNPKTFKVPIL